MSLFNVKKKLYKNKDGDKSEKIKPGVFNPLSEESQPNEQPLPEDAWTEKRRQLGVEEKKAIKKGVVALVVVLGTIILVFMVYKIRQAIFQESFASVSISGTNQVRSGQSLNFKIICQNDNTVSLRDVVLNVSYSQDFHPDEVAGFVVKSPTSGSFQIGEIKGHTKKEIILSGKGFSPRGTLMYLKADLVYRPKSFTGKFEARDQLGVTIISTPVNLEVKTSQNISSGDEINYAMTVKNEGESDLEGLVAKIIYPEGFVFSGANPPALEGNNVWNVGNLSPGDSKKIVATGRLSGEQGQTKSAKVQVGAGVGENFTEYITERADTRIISSPLVITQTMDGEKEKTVNAGDQLKFTLSFSNTGDLGLRDVIVKEKLESPALDYASLDIPGGSFDYDTKTITWKAADIRDLAKLEPGQTKEINFYIKVKKNLPVFSDADKNFVISSLATIDSPDVPTPVSMNKIISSNKMTMKVNSPLLLTVGAYYDDSQISNSGPIPPKVGEETTYTLHWKVSNVSNDVSGAKVEAYLPTNAVATGKIYPENASLRYNERTNSMIWDIGDIKAGTGVLNSPLEVSFQLKIKPSPDQANQGVKILGESIATAKDNFTSENLKATVRSKTTELREPGVAPVDGRVVP